MLNRFQRIREEFGTAVLIRIAVLLIGLVGMSLLGFFALSSLLAAIISIAGLALGFLLRRQIVKGAEYYPRAISAGLFIYPIVLFLGDRLGIENNAKLAVITLTTVIIFDLQFWSLSDSSIMNAERSAQK